MLVLPEASTANVPMVGVDRHGSARQWPTAYRPQDKVTA